MQVYFSSINMTLLLEHTLYDFGGQSASDSQRFLSSSVVDVDELVEVVGAFFTVEVVVRWVEEVVVGFVIVVGEVVATVTVVVVRLDESFCWVATAPMPGRFVQRHPERMAASARRYPVFME